MTITTSHWECAGCGGALTSHTKITSRLLTKFQVEQECWRLCTPTMVSPGVASSVPSKPDPKAQDRHSIHRTENPRQHVKWGGRRCPDPRTRGGCWAPGSPCKSGGATPPTDRNEGTNATWCGEGESTNTAMNSSGHGNVILEECRADRLYASQRAREPGRLLKSEHLTSVSSTKGKPRPRHVLHVDK